MNKVSLVCPTCNKSFLGKPGRFYCSLVCKNKINTADKGAVAELFVSAALLDEGYAVFRAVSPGAFCDLVAIKDGETRLIDVRTGHYTEKNVVSYNKGVNPQTTEIAVFIPERKEIIYIPLKAVSP